MTLSGVSGDYKMKNAVSGLFALSLFLITSAANAAYPGTAEIKRVCSASILKGARNIHEEHPEMSVASNVAFITGQIEEAATKWTPQALVEFAENKLGMNSDSEVCFAKVILKQRAAASGESPLGRTGVAKADAPESLAASGTTVPGSQDWHACITGQPTYSIAQQLSGCSAVIRVATTSPTDLAIAYNNRGADYAAQKNFVRAIVDYDRAISLRPDFADTIVNRATMFYAQNQYARAILDLDQALQLKPEKEVYMFRAGSFTQLRMYDRAISDYREALRIAPNYAEALNGICWVLALSGRNLNEARDHCDKALEFTPGDAPTLNTRAMVGLKQSLFEQAWKDYDAAFQIRHSGDDLYGRGIAYLRLNRQKEGLSDIAQAQALLKGIDKIYLTYGIKP